MSNLATAEPPKDDQRPQDWFAVLAFLLSLFIMVAPLEADFLDVLLRRGQLAAAGCVAALCFAIVLTPFLLSLRRRRKEPLARSGRGYLIAAGVILTLNLLFVGMLFTYQLFR